jgi:hypothetical protein
MLPGTDLLLTVARRTATVVPGIAPFAIFPPPFPIAAFEYGLLIRSTAQRDTALGWLVKVMNQTMKADLATSERSRGDLLSQNESPHGVSVRSDRSAAARWCRIVSTKDSGHYGA